MAIHQETVQVIRWSGGQHPTTSIITRLMKKEGLRPYMWENSPNFRYAVRSHNYNKTLYVAEGLVEITFPDTKQQTRLRPGDRVDIPAGIRHSTIVGGRGAKCIEASVRNIRRVIK